jgi:hypothetical protein
LIANKLLPGLKYSKDKKSSIISAILLAKTKTKQLPIQRFPQTTAIGNKDEKKEENKEVKKIEIGNKMLISNEDMILLRSFNSQFQNINNPLMSDQHLITCLKRLKSCAIEIHHISSHSEEFSVSEIKFLTNYLKEKEQITESEKIEFQILHLTNDLKALQEAIKKPLYVQPKQLNSVIETEEESQNINVNENPYKRDKKPKHDKNVKQEKKKKKRK